MLGSFSSSLLLLALCFKVTITVKIIKGAEIHYVYDDCIWKDKSNVQTKDSAAYVMRWRESGLARYYHNRFPGHSNVIVDCTYEISPRAQGSNGNYQELLYLAVRYIGTKFRIENQNENTPKLNTPKMREDFEKHPNQTAIKNVCDKSMVYGCVVISSNGEEIKSPINFDEGEDYQGIDNKLYTDKPITIRFYFLGGFLPVYTTMAPTTTIESNSTSTEAPAPPVTPSPYLTDITVPSILIEVTSFFAGPCSKSDQYYCKSTGACISNSLHCDGIVGNFRTNMINCASSDIKKNPLEHEDDKDCAAQVIQPMDQNNLNAQLEFWWMIALGALAGLILLMFICNFLWYRPGCLLWRLARLRNCCNQGTPCIKQCTRRCQTGKKSSKCCPCCREPFIPDSRGKVDNNFQSGWNRFAPGDGFHLRENR